MCRQLFPELSVAALIHDHLRFAQTRLAILKNELGGVFEKWFFEMKPWAIEAHFVDNHCTVEIVE